MSKSVVIFSGGQDSTTCLLKSLREDSETIALSFNYGQKNLVELECSSKICELLHVRHEIMDVSGIFHAVCSAPYLEELGVLGGKSELDSTLPSTWIPNRNMLFILIAHSFATKIGADKVITGVNHVDYSGYPDCREEFINSLRETLKLSVPASNVVIETPLINFSKNEIWKIADEMGQLDFIIEHTHTCYNGDHTHKNDWGYGCGECDSCKIRKKSFLEFCSSIKNY